MKEKQFDLIAKLIVDLISDGVEMSTIESVVNYSIAVIDLYKEETK